MLADFMSRVPNARPELGREVAGEHSVELARFTTSACSKEPSKSRVATPQRFFDAVKEDRLDLEIELLVESNTDDTDCTGSCVKSDALIALLRSLMKVGDSSLSN